MGFTKDTPGPLITASEPPSGGDANVREEARFLWTVLPCGPRGEVSSSVSVSSRASQSPDLSSVSGASLGDFLRKTEVVSPGPGQAGQDLGFPRSARRG